jgi:hypothetical protein
MPRQDSIERGAGCGEIFHHNGKRDGTSDPGLAVDPKRMLRLTAKRKYRPTLEPSLPTLLE